MDNRIGQIGTFFVSLAISLTVQSQEIPATIDALKGQPLRSYPRLILIEKLGLLDVFWSNDVDCAREPESCNGIVDQNVAVAIQRKLETNILAKIKTFDSVAGQLISNWSADIRPKLFPLTIKIELGQDIMNAGSIFDRTTVEIFSANGSSLGQTTVGSRISLGIRNAGNLESVDTLILHEFGHMLLRALGFPQMLDVNNGRVDSLVEETLADFISSSINNDTPYMAPGLQDITLKFAQEGLKDPKSDSFRRALMEGHLQGISNRAMRDFSLNYAYSDLYLLPGHYVSSLHFNGIFYRLKKVIKPDHLRHTVLRAIAERPTILLNGDAYRVVASIIALFSELYPEEYSRIAPQIQAILFQNDWVPATQTSQRLSFDIFQDAAKSVNVRIKPAASLISSLFPATMRCLAYTVSTPRTTKFSFTQFLDWSMQQRLKFVPVERCDSSTALCVCGDEKENISINALYIDNSKKASVTQTFMLQSEAFKDSPCYVLSFEWE